MKKNLLLLALTLFVIAANAQTNVSGGIYANTTWAKVNSPYIVTDTVVVFPNVTLTIEPGVVVKFANNTMLESRQGKIFAVGTNIDSITFTSNSPIPTPGIWSTIHINGGTLISVFEYCNIEYAKMGIYNHHLNGIQNTMAETQITNSTLRYNTSGFTSVGNGGGFTTITNTSFHDNHISIGVHYLL